MEKILRKAHHRVVHAGVAVGVVGAQHRTHRVGRLAVRVLRVVAALVHGVQDAPVHRLQAVPHVGQRPRHDHRHGVIQNALSISSFTSRIISLVPVPGIITKSSFTGVHLSLSCRMDLLHVQGGVFGVALDELAPGSTLSPIRMVKASSAFSASSMLICTITRFSGPWWSPTAAPGSSRPGPCTG